MKTEFNIIIIMTILVSVSLFLIYQNPDESPKSLSFEKYSNKIFQINENSKKYQLMEDEQRFDESKRLMHETLKEISLDYLEIKLSVVTLLEGQYPFWDVQYRVDKFDLEPSSICAFEQNMPLHLQKISQTDNFQRFAEKYSSYYLELIIMDERNTISNIHYGLIAINGENQRASTSFHLDSCTNEISDKEPYSLNCFNGNSDYKYATSNYDDVIASYSNTNFCKIELDPWRQSLQEYSEILYDKSQQLEIQQMSNTSDQDPYGGSFSGRDKLGELRSIVGSMVHGKFDEQSTQEKIKQYEKQYSSLPEELLKLIENRK